MLPVYNDPTVTSGTGPRATKIRAIKRANEPTTESFKTVLDFRRPWPPSKWHGINFHKPSSRFRIYMGYRRYHRFVRLTRVSTTTAIFERTGSRFSRISPTIIAIIRWMLFFETPMHEFLDPVQRKKNPQDSNDRIGFEDIPSTFVTKNLSPRNKRERISDEFRVTLHTCCNTYTELTAKFTYKYEVKLPITRSLWTVILPSV